MVAVKTYLEIYSLLDEGGFRTGNYASRIQQGTLLTYFPEGFLPTLYVASATAEAGTGRVAGTMEVRSGADDAAWPAVDDPQYPVWANLNGMMVQGLTFTGPERTVVTSQLMLELADSMMALSLHSKQYVPPVPPAPPVPPGEEVPVTAQLLATAISDLSLPAPRWEAL